MLPDQLLRTNAYGYLLQVLWCTPIASKFENIFFTFGAKILGIYVPWSTSSWNVRSRGTKGPQGRKLQGANVPWNASSLCALFTPGNKKFRYPVNVAPLKLYTSPVLHRVTTCRENLEMSGNLTAVREMSGILPKKSGKCQGKNVVGKSCLKLFIVSCIFVFLQVFSMSLFQWC